MKLGLSASPEPAMTHRHSVSVLMPCLNPGGFLDEAIASCLNQPELKQLLVADGGSEAATVERLRAWAGRDPRVVWWSGSDGGPADALNRALVKAEADLIGWLNADDRYEPGCLQRAVQALSEHHQWQMVYGHGQHVDEAGGFLELYPSREPAVGLEAFQEGCFICQPTVLLRRHFLEQLGGFDASWRVCFDLDLWLRAFSVAPEAIGFVPALQASTRLHRDTITARQQWRVQLESAALLQRSCGAVQEHWLHAAAAALIHQETPSQPSARLEDAEALLATPDLIDRLRAAVQGLLQSSSLPMERTTLPHDLVRLLHSRPDLLGCGFHQLSHQQAFAQWLLLHGLREYPALIEGDAATNPVLAWLAQPPVPAALPRIAQAIWDSTARHQRRWPLPRRAAAYQRWLRRHWLELPQQPMPSHSALFGISRGRRLLQRILGTTRISPGVGIQALGTGVNLIGYARHALGIGEDLRTTELALRQVGVPTRVIDFPPGDCPGRLLSGDSPSQGADDHNRTTILCLTAEETTRYVLSCGRSLLRSCYVIGYWPWELPIWPAHWRQALELVDEIWVSSRHIQTALEGETSKPVLCMPLCVDAGFLELTHSSDADRLQQRLAFQLPANAVLALCSFDLSSYSQRKNPWGAIQTFQRAFPPALVGGGRTDVGLVVKTFPPARPHQDWERLKRVAALDPRIQIVEASLSREVLSALYGCCDVLLSLHRAEGFGRVLAEALQLGLDVIATDWSGNTDFCHGPLAHPVPCSLVPVPPGAYPHWPGQHWADPDLTAAADTLVRVVQTRLSQGRPGQEICVSYREQFSASSCGMRYRKRLDQLELLSAPGELPYAATASSPLLQG
ncbi:MAG: glycosyltransferase [Cyanobacteriota bacterium]|nr:glycosyltransferase [Cyanobacteriota bacterium]